MGSVCPRPFLLDEMSSVFGAIRMATPLLSGPQLMDTAIPVLAGDEPK